MMMIMVVIIIVIIIIIIIITMKIGRIVEIGLVSFTFTLGKGERLWRERCRTRPWPDHDPTLALAHLGNGLLGSKACARVRASSCLMLKCRCERRQDPDTGNCIKAKYHKRNLHCILENRVLKIYGRLS